MRLIDADALIAYCDEKWIPLNIDAVNEQPTIEERKTGEWVDFSMSIKGVPTEACGVCGEWSYGMGKNYCPNCGARMMSKRIHELETELRDYENKGDDD